MNASITASATTMTSSTATTTPAPHPDLNTCLELIRCPCGTFSAPRHHAYYPENDDVTGYFKCSLAECSSPHGTYRISDRQFYARARVCWACGDVTTGLVYMHWNDGSGDGPQPKCLTCGFLYDGSCGLIWLVMRNGSVGGYGEYEEVDIEQVLEDARMENDEIKARISGVEVCVEV